ncbi:hypothetical protein A2867_03685 [Candidatus Daviesbacteria bacterium RIFCSPHIGHO2_01_FULL_40_11]|uniref:Uncharacterized protein n=1 Tax=Candidatus Daviesbacteria bacterium RIFCSPHIGHO2_01_FULL_40_11 TaxID=1797762 RepID=A0A1F5JG25_9BACT|nr:MAG: hypothetical protein A2867_03685 [Candidatus Daviesbacteria bacterium RIFCSPHIGHO2_01_FULL_40_11]
MNEILSIILKDTYSLTSLKHRLRILQSYFLKTFFGEIETSVNMPLSPQDSNWLKSLPSSFYQKFNKDNIYNIFSGLEKIGTNTPILTMHLAFELNDTTLSQIGAFTRKTFDSPSLLLDIKVDPNLIAGTALSWKGVYRDYSLRAKLEQKRQELLEEFRKFLR